MEEIERINGVCCFPKLLPLVVRKQGINVWLVVVTVPSHY